MKKTLYSLLCIIIFLNTFLLLSPGYTAKARVSRDITYDCSIKLNGRWIDEDLIDGKEETYLKYDSAKIVIKSYEPVGGVYIKFDRTPQIWSLSYEKTTFSCGNYGFLHEYQSVYFDNVRTLTLTFYTKTSISDIYVLSRGEKLPDFVQTWRPAEGKCDIMLLSCHSDDDQLFFAGSVPDAVSRGAEMQVCYFTNHWNTHQRPHELLNGLWACGLDRYPVIGRFPDFMRVDSESEMLSGFLKRGYTYDQMVEDQVELLRKYKPQIVLVHDVYGEYGHAAHKLDSHSLRDAAAVSNNPFKYPKSAEKFGVWEVPKIYIHLYSRNKIDFEIDVPLQRFDGKTAYQVSQDAFLCHISQMTTRYKEWLLGTEEKPVTDSHDFPKYSPRDYGLWQTNVGADRRKTDFYENIVLLKDQPPKETTAEETTAEETTAEETTDEVTTVEEVTTAEETTVEEATEEETAEEETTVEITATEETAEEETTTEETETETEVSDTETEEKETPVSAKNKTDTGKIVNICAACGIVSVVIAAAIFGIKSKK
ncbi:MAG: PIG-L family deacetylase [Clostridia bacterium]|nr:PIG-L family deacetylase [Clostridia bacterium]